MSTLSTEAIIHLGFVTKLAIFSTIFSISTVSSVFQKHPSQILFIAFKYLEGKFLARMVHNPHNKPSLLIFSISSNYVILKYVNIGTTLVQQNRWRRSPIKAGR